MSEARYVTFQVVGNVNVYYAVITVNGYYRTKYYCQRSISVNYCTTRKAAVRYDTGLLYRVAQKTEGTLFDCYIYCRHQHDLKSKVKGLNTCYSATYMSQTATSSAL